MKRIGMLTLALAFCVTPLAAQDIPLSKILVEKDSWREVARGLKRITWIEGEPKGDIAIYTGERSALLRIDRKVDLVPLPPFLTPTRDNTVVRARSGSTYRIAKDGKGIDWSVADKTETRTLPGLIAPTCLTLWPDQGHLVIGEADGAYLWAVRIESNGSLGPGDRYYSLRTRPNEKMHVTAMTIDAGNLLYACTPLGVQVFDPTGRLSGVIPAPSKEPMIAITLGGANADELFVAAGEKIFARRIQGKASYTLKKDK